MAFRRNPPEDEGSPSREPELQEELNLAAEEPPPPNRLARPGTKFGPREEEYNPAPARERVRGVLAIGLFVLVSLLAGGSYALVAVNRLSKEDMEALNPIFAALVTLTGTAIGFYFGGGGGKNGGPGKD